MWEGLRRYIARVYHRAGSARSQIKRCAVRSKIESTQSPVQSPVVARIALRYLQVLGACGLALCAAVTGARAADTLLQIEWSDPDIQNFVEARKADAGRGLAPAEPSRLDKVKLPVLGFQGAPGLVQSSFPGLGPQPTGTRDIVTDETNPVWYQIVDTYGDVTVSVSADLRVQHTFGADYPVYDTTPPGAAPQAGPQVSVMDGTVEDGMEGAIAEYTITKFGVPYTVTIECTAATKERCADVTQIAKDSELLKLIAATPPN